MGGRVLRSLGRVSNLPPPSGTVLRRCRCRCRHHPSPSRCSATPPFQPAPVRVFGGVQRIDSPCWKHASVITFFTAPAVVGGPVVAVVAPVLLGVAAVRAREASAPTPCGRGWSRHLTAKPGALSSSPTPTLPPARSFFSLLPLPLSRWMASANSTACSSAGRHCRCRSSPFSTKTTQVSDDDDYHGIDDATATLRPPRNAADSDRDAPLSDR